MTYYDQSRNFTQLNSDVDFCGTWSGKPVSLGSLAPESTFEQNFESKNFRSSSITSLNLSYFDSKSVLDISDTSSILEKQSRSDEKRRVKNQDNDIQKQKVILSCLGRYLITIFLSVGYILTLVTWLKKSAVTATEKKIFNSIVTGISIALGLNISSALRDIALIVRWPILALGKQKLRELDLILQAHSLSVITKLAFFSRRPAIIFGCLGWLSFNLIIQIGLALLSLTYSFDIDSSDVKFKDGAVAVPKLDRFYPQTNRVVSSQSLQDEQYTAHTYGEFALNFGIGLAISEPVPNQIYSSTDPLIWIDKRNSLMNFIFLDSPEGSQLIEDFSIFTPRKINVTYSCNSFFVFAGGDGKSTNIVVSGIGNISLPQAVPESSTFLLRAKHDCESGERCSIIEVFESSYTDPWYYSCEISMGLTQNDPLGISTINDVMAKIAIASIAQIGYTDSFGTASQIYPRESMWGQASRGKSEDVGMMIGIYALASIAGIAQFNPFTSYPGKAPGPGFKLQLSHSKFFYGIILLINVSQLLFIILTFFLAKRVKLGPLGFIGISLLLKPVTNRLPLNCDQEDDETTKRILENTYALYEKDSFENRWSFKLRR
ncbi:hypothetical protein GcM3_079018 [Golovinomyces cichoracearum]|uniref:Uncharacterized protein n=1 Tax=Golovinomyces cichoracearum TaxID=62708 RepID=A0A420IP80_9PEZI|nr:hypothetical protein GcM3_079018 [Golovinomyces cichoracearum]